MNVTAARRLLWTGLMGTGCDAPAIPHDPIRERAWTFPIGYTPAR